LKRLALALALLAAAAAGAHEEAPAATPLFEPPPPGSYELPPIDQVREHELLDEQGLPARLPGLAPGQAAVVSFVYASCPEAHGCPLALATVQRLDRELARRAELSGRVRLVTVSFDPGRDTPAHMAELRDRLAPAGAWQFLTAPGRAALAPVLEDYGQRVAALVDAEGVETGILQHVLKVFLLDDRLRIRNVYSAGLLDARLVLNDVETVLAEPAPGEPPCDRC
jgi:cytochrome oxidase Cu insertion factor (SCO1/SenC/PrrC family)